jgi:hypothetical protein
VHRLRIRVAAASAFALFIMPAWAAAQPLTPAGIFGDSAPLQKLIILALIVSILAAVGIAVARTMRGQGGSAFVSALRIGGPLLGLFGAIYSTLNGFIGLANVPVTPPLRVIAPGVAESLFVLGLGVLASVVAVLAHWAMEARSGRAAKAA